MEDSIGVSFDPPFVLKLHFKHPTFTEKRCNRGPNQMLREGAQKGLSRRLIFKYDVFTRGAV